MVSRRNALWLALGALAAAPAARAQSPGMPRRAEGDGTPAQFLPRNAPDPQPQVDDLAKFPKCPYCGMDRRQFHHSRMLIQYSNDVPDGVCSLHCAAISLSLNIDAEPKAIWVADNGVDGEPKPLVDVDRATFLIGSSAKGVMTLRSKVAYGDEAAARRAQGAMGGELGDFNQALLAAYTDMSRDVARIRQNREERRQRMKAMPKG
jgi:nitrous oxide reductase accessory protein NosL